MCSSPWGSPSAWPEPRFGFLSDDLQLLRKSKRRCARFLPSWRDFANPRLKNGRLDMLVDTHCHLHFEQFDADREDVIARARGAGIARIVNVGTDPVTNQAAHVLS